MKWITSVSQGSAATHLRCGGMCYKSYMILVGNIFLFQTVKKFENQLRFDEVSDKKVTGSHFFGPLCTRYCSITFSVALP